MPETPPGLPGAWYSLRDQTGFSNWHVRTFTDHGEAGWRARYVGTGAGAGRIFVYGSEVWTQEPDSTSRGIPDIVSPASDGSFSTGWNATAPYLDGAVLNAMKEMINGLLVLLTTSDGLAGDNRGNASPYWGGGRSNIGQSLNASSTTGTPTKGEAEGDFSGGTHLATGPNVPQSWSKILVLSGTGTYTLFASEGIIKQDVIALDGVHRQCEFYVRGAGAIDQDGTQDFSPGSTGLQDETFEKPLVRRQGWR